MTTFKRIVFAVHSFGEKEYIFEVPECMNIKEGDILYVETMYGPKIAIATGNVAVGEYTDKILLNLGAYLPLRKVLAYANKEIQEYIHNSTVNGIISKLEDEKCNPDIPF